MPAEPYTALAQIYQTAGLADYARELAPGLFNLIYDLNWQGRALLDLGCGTGDVICWFAERSLRATGLDASTAMLKQARADATARGLVVDFVVGDMRAYKSSTTYDLVLALGGALNYIATLRELEAVFRAIYSALEPGKLFIFDLHTIKGLASQPPVVVLDKPDKYVLTLRQSFNYDVLTLTIQYLIFIATGNTWSRADETHLIRRYPVQGVLRALSQANLKLVRTLTPDFQDAENNKNADMLLLVAQRE